MTTEMRPTETLPASSSSSTENTNLPPKLTDNTIDTAATTATHNHSEVMTTLTNGTEMMMTTSSPTKNMNNPSTTTTITASTDGGLERTTTESLNSNNNTFSTTTTSSELGTTTQQSFNTNNKEEEKNHNHNNKDMISSSTLSSTKVNQPSQQESLLNSSSEEVSGKESQQEPSQQLREGSSSSSSNDDDEFGEDDEDAEPNMDYNEEDEDTTASQKYNILLPHKNDVHLLSTLRSKVSNSPIYLTHYTSLESTAMRMKRRHNRSIMREGNNNSPNNNTTSLSNIINNNNHGIHLSQSLSLDSFASSSLASSMSSAAAGSLSISSSQSALQQQQQQPWHPRTPNSGIFLNDMNGTLFQEESALKLFLSHAYNKKHSSSAAIISASSLFTSASSAEDDAIHFLIQSTPPSSTTATTTTGSLMQTPTTTTTNNNNTSEPSSSANNQQHQNINFAAVVENLNNCKIYYFYTPYEKAFMSSTTTSSSSPNVSSSTDPSFSKPSSNDHHQYNIGSDPLKMNVSALSNGAGSSSSSSSTTESSPEKTTAPSSSTATSAATPVIGSSRSGSVTGALIEIGDHIQQQANHHHHHQQLQNNRKDALKTMLPSSNSLSNSTTTNNGSLTSNNVNNNNNGTDTNEPSPVNTVVSSSSAPSSSTAVVTTLNSEHHHPPHHIKVEPPTPQHDRAHQEAVLLLENNSNLNNIPNNSLASEQNHSNETTGITYQYSSTNPHRRVQSDTSAFQRLQIGSTTATSTTTDSNGSNDSQDNLPINTPPQRRQQQILRDAASINNEEQNSFDFTNNATLLDQSEGDIRFMLGNEELTPGSSAITSPSTSNSDTSQLGMSLPVNGSSTFDVSRSHMKRSGSVRGLNKNVFSPIDKKKAHRRVKSFNVAPITPSLGFTSESEVRSITIELVFLDIDACFTKFEPLRIISDMWTKDLDYFKFGVKIFNRMYVWLEDSLVHQFTVEKSDLVDCPSIEFTLPEQPVAKIIDATCAIINEFNTKYTYSYYNCHSFSFARKVAEKLSGKKIKSKNVLPKTLVHHFREWREAEKKRKEKEEKEEKEQAKSSSTDKSPVTNNGTATTAETSSEVTHSQKDQVTSNSSSSGSKEDLNSPKPQSAEKPKNPTLDPLDYLDLMIEEERMRDVNFLYYVPKRLLLKKYRKFHQKQEIKNHTYLLNLINSLLEQCPNFKEEYKMDYYILKTLDRWFWAEKYLQENYDPIKQKSKFFHKEGTKIHFPEPTFLKEIVLEKKNRRRKIFNVKVEDPELDVDYNDPSAVLWKNVDGHLVTNFEYLRQEKKGKTVKVLTMDGGGMKGLILIEILTVIEERVGKKICDIFDIVAGTSTGGICALLINRGISMKAAKEIYIEIGRTVFDLKTTRNKSFVKTMKVLRGRSWYDGYPLELSSLKLSQDVELNHMHVKKPLTFIVTTMNKSTNPKMNLDEPTACVLRTYSDPYEFGVKNGDSSSKKQPTFYRGTTTGAGITCTDALRATSAAPMYFKPRKIGDTECIDGAVVANNPTSIALYETKQIFPNHDKFVFISLGTGALSGKSSQQSNDGDEEVNLNISPTTKTKKKGISKVFKGISQTINTLLSVVNLQLSSERIHKMASAQLEFFKEGKSLCEYFRLNVPKLGDYGLDEISDELVAIFEKETKAYIENHPDLDRICELLKQE